MLEQDLASLEQKVGQLFFVGIAGPELDETTAALIDEVRPGGVCLFSRNIRSREQTRRLLDALWERLETPLLSVDQEGGLVDRLKRILPPMPAASRIQTVPQAAEQARLIGEALGTLGFNMNFAPVADVGSPERGKAGNGLHSRTYGSSSADVAELAGAFSESLHTAGILDCIKHFPGLGASQVDSHEELPHVDVDPGELEAVDILPYRKLLARASSVMVAHAAYPSHPLQETDSAGRMLPSSLSSNFVTGLLRDELRFQRLVVTDDLEMGAIVNSYGIGEAAKMAIKAGADMLAICADPDKIREAVRAMRSAVAAGEISAERIDESLNRVAAAKKTLRPRTPYDQDRLDGLAMQISEFADGFQ